VTPGTADSLAGVDHLIVGRAFAAAVTGEDEPAAAAAALARMRAGKALSAVTAGAQGCWYVQADGRAGHQPALCVDVVDTTGCGDVFHGAYAAELARGESTEQALRVAAVMAGIKATRPGGRQGIPDRAEVEARLHSLA
jgi:sugar/nucleoside kinase (ribokinase family)